MNFKDRCLTAILIVTSLLFCGKLLAIENNDFQKNPQKYRFCKTRVENENEQKILVNDSCYDIAVVRFVANKKQAYRIEIIAKSPDAAKIGAVAYYVERKLKTVKNIGWNRMLKKDYRKITFDLDINDLKKLKLPRQISIHFYRINKKGQIKIKDIKVINTSHEIAEKINKPIYSEVKTCTNLDDFFIGPYVYSWAIGVEKTTPQEWLIKFDKEMGKLQSYGFNAVYLGMGGSNENLILDSMNVLKKHHMKVIPQLSAFYFQPKWKDEVLLAQAAKAAVFFKKYKDNPSVIAWSIKEEIMPKDVDRLADYYRRILNDCPNVKLDHQFHNDESAKIFPKPYPEFSGGIIYGFVWDCTGGGVLYSPLQALLYSRRRIARQYRAAARRGANFIMTITGNSYAAPKDAWKYCEPESKEKYAPVFRKLADTGTLGWTKTENPLGYNHWVRYSAPTNCLKAISWLSVMEGARGILNWSYTIPENDIRAKEKANGYITEAANSQKKENIVTTLWPNPFIPDSEALIKEFAQASKELRPFSKIIVKMRKLESSPVIINTENVFNRAFKYPEMKGWIVVATNFNVGTWPLNNKRSFHPGDKVYIDKYGRLKGYVPYTKPQKIKFELLDIVGSPEVIDLGTGKTIKKDNGYYVCDIMPGSGVFLYIGSQSEANKLMKIKKISI